MEYIPVVLVFLNRQDNGAYFGVLCVPVFVSQVGGSGPRAHRRAYNSLFFDKRNCHVRATISRPLYRPFWPVSVLMGSFLVSLCLYRLVPGELVIDYRLEATPVIVSCYLCLSHLWVRYDRQVHVYYVLPWDFPRVEHEFPGLAFSYKRGSGSCERGVAPVGFLSFTLHRGQRNLVSFVYSRISRVEGSVEASDGPDRVQFDEMPREVKEVLEPILLIQTIVC